MRFSQLFAPVLCLCVSTLSAQAAPTPAEIISKARARIGTEEQLRSVKTLAMQGDLFDKDGKKVGYVETKSKLPNMRREYQLRHDVNVELINASNGLEGYLKLNQGPRQQTRPYSLSEIGHNTEKLKMELGFYAAPEGGSVSYEGEALQQGKACYVLVYKYKNGPFYSRFFDKQTGQFIAEEIYEAADTPQNKRLLAVAEGEISPAGLPIRFPKKITHFLDGQKQNAVEFTKVEINTTIEDSEFNFPMPMP